MTISDGFKMLLARIAPLQSEVDAAERHIAPIGLEAEFSVRPRKALDEMRAVKVRLEINPVARFEISKGWQF